MDKREIERRVSNDIIQGDNILNDYVTFIHNKIGLDIRQDNRDLIKAVSSACDKYNLTPGEYLKLLQSTGEQTNYIDHLISYITVGETYFFRDKNQVKLLNEFILPSIISRKIEQNDKTIRVWSAGCSSGEEIYTVIILLKELLGTFDGWNCSFTATDINVNAMKKGDSGVYGEWSMRSIPEYYLNKYFEKNGSHYKIDHFIKNQVRFEYLNLNTDDYPSIVNGTFALDLVLCRNVLIYFDDSHINNIIRKLSKCVVNDGYILLGASDPIAKTTSELHSIQGMPSLFIKSRQENLVISRFAPERSDPHVNVSLFPVNDRVVEKDFAGETEHLNRSNVKNIDSMLKEGRWSDVVNAVERESMHSGIPPELSVFEAIAYANMGKAQDAMRACEEAINKNKMIKEAYYIYALALAEAKRLREAEAAFRKALFLDPDYIMCRYQFGIFLIHQNRRNEGIKVLKRLILSVENYKGNDIVPDSNEMSYQQLAKILNNEIELYQ